MFCPKCRDEFRPGFTRCAACDVDLVPSLDEAAPLSSQPWGARPVESAPTVVAMTEYCGFVSLSEAREARDRLRAAGIRGEIVIRDSPGGAGRSEPEEEYWLRVERDRYGEAFALLGFDEASHEHEHEHSTFECGACGAEVDVEESACPRCGARFEDA